MIEQEQDVAKLDVGGERMSGGVLTKGLVQLDLDGGRKGGFEGFAVAFVEVGVTRIRRKWRAGRHGKDVGEGRVCGVLTG